MNYHSCLKLKLINLLQILRLDSLILWTHHIIQTFLDIITSQLTGKLYNRLAQLISFFYSQSSKLNELSVPFVHLRQM